MPQVRTYTPIGLDIRAGSLHAVQFRVEHDALTLHAAASERVHADTDGVIGPEALAALKRLANSGAFAGRRVVAAVPNPEVDIRPIAIPESVPQNDATAFGEALDLEARSSLLYDPAEAVLDCLPLHDVDEPAPGTERMLLVAARKEGVFWLLALLREAGLSCECLDINPCATVRALPQDARTIAAVSIDYHHTEVSIAENGELRFSRTLNVGVQRLIDTVATWLDVDAPQAEDFLCRYGLSDAPQAPGSIDNAADSGVLDDSGIAAALFEASQGPLATIAAEIRRTLEYFARQRAHHAIERILLTGPIMLPGMAAYLANALSLPTETPGVADANPGLDDNPVSSASEYVTAIGLALRENAA